MNRKIRIAELKARLSECLRAVRKGHRFMVTDGDTPIAELIPYRPGEDALVVRGPVGTFGSLARVPLPPRVKLEGDVVDVLLAERQGDR